MDDKIDVTEPNKIISNSMSNRWNKQSYVQGFDCKFILFKKSANMFKSMEILESIYEGVVTNYY